MNQVIDGMWDDYLSQSLTNHEKLLEREWLFNCEECTGALYEYDEVYKIDNHYYCEDCIKDCKIVLSTD